ncbi:D-glycero-beta-D-manno-heptose 1,7-bisphosphate 7-phosphatase [Halopseudomonas nanhaiensis]|uniref:D-glycero-beta-D-manno-heptose 1,7-bisphosphate 7-phosphatase n=1 Tax=Halopseudomonas nanhaiensis TaxID=2830842 RepID=UPI001CBBE2B4|nr:D-glycero-beta-D-manno-heptose 1,7-bisphosphate 7-phosphatase [Halopseudomonas nanhaiensis]UAW98419.1 D-glycero-beta-D-manno-heptose 1,7-bisphosphate 7-phosphatase [Halopseudomonas nanhaiensis]
MKLIILDRDGVINVDSEEYVKSPEEWIPIPGSIEAVARLTRAGWTVCVATNQSGLARGLFDVAALEAMHDKMRGLVERAGGALEMIVYCPHGPDDSCDCRKPLSGLFQQIADYYRIPLTDVPTVGDSRRDLEAGSALGCTPYLVRTGKGRKTASQALPAGTQIFDDLAAVAEHLLETQA